MYRVLLSLLLIASLLAGAIAPCCVEAADGGAAPEAAAETGHHCGGDSNPAAPASDANEACKDCVHCLQPASPLRAPLLLSAALLQVDVPSVPVGAAPIKPQAPPLRPPIQLREQA